MPTLRYEEVHDWDLKRIVVYHAIRAEAESDGEQESDGAFLMHGVHGVIAHALDIQYSSAYPWVAWLLQSKILSVAQEALAQNHQQYRFTPIEDAPTVEEYRVYEDDVRLLSRNYWEWKRRTERLSKIASAPRPKRATAPITQLDQHQVQRIRAAVMSSEDDRLLDITEAAERLRVKVDYLYHHWRTLPFALLLGKKQLRFSLHGMQVYFAIMLEQQNELQSHDGDDEC